MSARDDMHLIHRYGVTIVTADFEGQEDLFEHGRWTMEGSEPFVGRGALLQGVSQLQEIKRWL
jgi:hypothetical protein